ncbi:Vitelline membrane outer layer protein 1 [Orchesella cincta]|uniref:Vitelline membrane outer layer protein 1 n=1 Tax=Orchesella cincta TaxID=48709 RepID=A0A1D2MD37_ORCCI|nr:Vitelline membrane outer layer protein 1 [Orchesella cincta]
MGNSLKPLIFFGTLYFLACRVFSNLELRSPVITDWGDWHFMDDCPQDKFVVGMQLRTHNYQGFWTDDSALNGVKFFCDQLGSRSDQIAVASGQENHGSFGTKKFCDGVATGFQLRSEGSQGWASDDTAGNNLRLICNANSSTQIEGDGLDFGSWTTPQECNRKQGLCGYSSQIDHDLSSGDITGLNNIKMKCCSIPDPAETCEPEDKWDLLIECDNIDALTETTCQYTRKVGISHSAAYSEGYSHLVSTYVQVGFTLDQALSALGINFGTNLGRNSTTGYDWTASTSDVWSVETTTSISFNVPPGVRTQLFQTMGKCGIYTVRATRVRRVDTEGATNNQTVTFIDI